MLFIYTCIFTKSAQMGENIQMSYTENQAVILSLKNEAASNMEKNLASSIQGCIYSRKLAFKRIYAKIVFLYEFT